MFLVIEKDKIEDFIEELKKKFIVINALKTKSLLPLAKKHLFPPKEETFRLDADNDYININVPQKETVIFGLNPADLRAVTFLDEIMEKPEPDFFYFQKREKTTLIGFSDYTLPAAFGGDMVFEKINSEQYKVLVLTEKGKKISSDFFKEVKKPKIQKYPFKKTPLHKMLLDSELLSDVVAWSVKHKIWDELDKKCLGCGNCTYVCPLCYCFSVEDKFSLSDEGCSRCRIWDACTLPDFAKITGGHDFHPTIKMRYYNWFYHKFVRGYKEFGRSLCVGCHRCQETCPAGIDIEEILTELIGEYKNCKK